MLYGGLIDGHRIWDQFQDFLCNNLSCWILNNDLYCNPIIARPDLDYSLYLIDKDLRADDRKLQDFGLPQYQNC
jgi:hypothetical protein